MGNRMCCSERGNNYFDYEGKGPGFIKSSEEKMNEGKNFILTQSFM